MNNIIHISFLMEENMKFIYNIKDLEKLKVNEDIKYHSKIEIIDICSSVDSIINLNNFNLHKFGAILILNSAKELNDILSRFKIRGYGNIVLKCVEERILEDKKIFIIKFINNEDKLIECIIDSDIISKLSCYSRNIIETNIFLIKKYDGSKLVL